MVSGAAKLQFRRPASADALFVLGSLLAILAITWFSLVTQPATLATTAWWPAAGVALGLGIRFPRVRVWPLAMAVALITFPVLIWAGRPLLLAVGLSAAVGLEMVVGTLILRGRQDVLPSLSAPRDIGRLLVAVVAAAVTYDLVSVAVSLAVGDTAGAWTRFVTGAPKHAAGMILLTPLFMSRPERPSKATRLEAVAQIAVSLAVAVGVFAVNPRLPLAFLPFVPLVWAALRLSTRLMLLEILAVAAIASVGSTRGDGPFAFDRLGAEWGSIMLQIFEVSIVIVFLALSLSVGREREMAQRLNESEELFRRIFDASVAGQLIVQDRGDGWVVQRNNGSAESLLPRLVQGETHLRALLGDSASASVSAKAAGLIDGHAVLTTTTDTDRVLHISMVPIHSGNDGRLLALQFHDVTEATRVRQLEREELERAAEVQRALLPGHLPSAPGWQAAAKSVPAAEVGGDFYDLRLDGSEVVLSLGDVMGKGMGAGMLAAATRAALRASPTGMGPATAVHRTAAALDGDLHRTNAFVTLANVHVDLTSGEYWYADAGHGLHFVVRNCGASVEHVTSGDMPIGLGGNWTAQKGMLEPGDALLLVSDGVMDIWGATVEQLHDAVTHIARVHCGDAHALIDALCEGAEDVSQLDDVTALVLGREPVPTVMADTGSCDIAASGVSRSDAP